MDKPYYAILMRMKGSDEFYYMSDEERRGLSQDEEEYLMTRVLSKSTDFNSICEEFKSLTSKEFKDMAKEELSFISGNNEISDEDVSGVELSIVRISYMTDWK